MVAPLFLIFAGGNHIFLLYFSSKREVKRL